MAGTLQFDLVSPERLLLSEAVAMVVVPAAEGAMGILPDHAPLIATLRPGVIEVYGQTMQAVTSRVFVSGGFLEVTPTRATVLAEETADPATLDRAEIEAQLKNLREDLADAKGAFERDQVQRKIEIAEAKLALAGGSVAAVGH